uniref:Granulins domain-containing protein n=1 Tax=Phragmatopoma lapidosa TaxID=341668 RepID=A0A0A0QZ26_9ANNE|nr:hypothetical protein [Phragmatopoma lapidosa]
MNNIMYCVALSLVGLSHAYVTRKHTDDSSHRFVETISNLNRGRGNECPDGTICDELSTCCLRSSGQYACCSAPNAVCCEIGCCNAGYSCCPDRGCCPDEYTCCGGNCCLQGTTCCRPGVCCEECCTDGGCCSGSHFCCNDEFGGCCADGYQCCETGCCNITDMTLFVERKITS